MPTHIKIIHAHEFIRANAEGKLNLKESEKLLLEIMSMSAKHRKVKYEVILDTRKAQSELSFEDLWKLTDEFGKFRKGLFPGKTAVLCPLERFDHAGFFALCAQNSGYQINAFTSYSDAMEWLLET